MTLRRALETIHNVLTINDIDHALIGGFALAIHGVPRATGDIDLLIDERSKDLVISTLTKNGFSVEIQTPEVLHFSGPCRLDILLARRPLSKEMLNRAKKYPPVEIKCLDVEDIIGLKIQAFVNNRKREFQDKADILNLVQKHQNLDWDRIKTYADLFNIWNEIQEIKNK